MNEPPLEHEISYHDLAPLLTPDGTEGCGFLVGPDRGTITAIWPCPSLTPSPMSYSIGRDAHIKAGERARAEGLTLLGTIHTHPAGPDGPSHTDLAIARKLAPFEWRAVWDVASGNLTLYDRDGIAWYERFTAPPADYLPPRELPGPKAPKARSPRTRKAASKTA